MVAEVGNSQGGAHGLQKSAQVGKRKKRSGGGARGRGGGGGGGGGGWNSSGWLFQGGQKRCEGGVCQFRSGGDRGKEIHN